jgi:hypothetical protein
MGLPDAYISLRHPNHPDDTEHMTHINNVEDDLVFDSDVYIHVHDITWEVFFNENSIRYHSGFGE